MVEISLELQTPQVRYVFFSAYTNSAALFSNVSVTFVDWQWKIFDYLQEIEEFQ